MKRYESRLARYDLSNEFVFFRDVNTGNLDFISVRDMVKYDIKIEPRFIVAVLDRNSICKFVDSMLFNYGKA